MNISYGTVPYAGYHSDHPKIFANLRDPFPWIDSIIYRFNEMMSRNESCLDAPGWKDPHGNLCSHYENEWPVGSCDEITDVTGTD